MQLNGTQNGSIVIDPSGVLRGIGVVISEVINNGGTVIPGGSIGTISILGSFASNAASTTQIEIDPSASSLIAVTGTATLGGAVVVVQDPGSYATRTEYTILTAMGGISSTFASLNSLAPGFIGELVYNPTSVMLILQLAGTLPIPSIGGNAARMANYLNKNAMDAALQPIAIALGGLSTSQYAAALQSITPARNASSVFSAQNTMFTFSDAVSTHLGKLRVDRSLQRHNLSLASSDPLSWNEDELSASFSDLFKKNRIPVSPSGSTKKIAKGNDRFSFYIDGFSEFFHQDAQDQIPAFHVLSGGALVGFDGFLQNGQVGTAAGFARNTVSESGNEGKNEIDFYTISFYGTGYIQNGYFESALWGTYNRIENSRYCSFPGFKATAKSRTQGAEITPHLAGGYDFNRSGWLTLEPYASFDFAIDFQKGYKEHGAHPLNMKVRQSTSCMLRSELGLNSYQTLRGDWGLCIFRETLSYINRAPFSTGKMTAAIVGAEGTFSVDSFTTSQNLFAPAFEIFIRKRSGAFSITYAGEFGSGYITNEILGSIGVLF